MSLTPAQHLTALMAAYRDGDADAIPRMWRELTSVEQEAVALELLGMHPDATSPDNADDAEARPDMLAGDLGEGSSRREPDVTQIVTPVAADVTQVVPTQVQVDATRVVPAVAESERPLPPATAPVESGATALIPKAVEDLRGLTGSENEDGHSYGTTPISAQDSRTYRARWRKRWKGSALASALAVTILFILTGRDAYSYGPMEWFVTIFATVIGGGLLVGTLVNFVVAAIPTLGHSRPGR